MGRRAIVPVFVVVALAGALLPAAVAASAPPPLPGSIAAVGDSISQAVSSGGSLGATYPANSWSTGTNTSVISHYQRLLALDPAIGGHAFNDSVSGAKMADLNGQMQVAAGQHPDYLTVLIGGNDLCTDTVGQMTSITDFRAQLTTAMNTLTTGSPGTRVLLVSIPDVYQLWSLFHSSWTARLVWSLGGICQSLLANPTSTTSSDVQRRAQVAQRNIDFNDQLAQVCALYASCRFDGNAVYDVVFAKSDIAGDYFHPSVSGQAKLAATTWAAGYWPNGGPVTDNPPTAAFSASCTNLACTFDGSGSSDDNGIVSFDWTFGDDGAATGVTSAHTFAAAGTYTVTLSVTDTIGQPASVSHDVDVVAGSGGSTVHLASASGSATPRKGGWTATFTVTVADGAGASVSGATVTGSLSTGGSGGCTTGSAGSCSFGVNEGKKATSVTWTVTGISASGSAYDATADQGSPVLVQRP
jgi:lysophospholipase L1-like esterase